MEMPLEEMYFRWLYSLVANAEETRKSRCFWNLLRKFHQKEFTWFVLNDDNRVEDGKALRYEFMEIHGIRHVERAWLELGCSFLEMLIGLSRRAEFEGGYTSQIWFWHFVRMLDLTAYSDRVVFPETEIEDVMDTVIWRTYLPDGNGGLFPLRDPQQDQRQLEIWDQLNAYLIEND